jgi:hypothetical protein
VFGSRRFNGGHNAARDDQHGTDEQEEPERFVQERQCDQDRNQRSHTHEHRGSRRSGITDRDGQEDLRDTGCDQPRGEEWQQRGGGGCLVRERGCRDRERGAGTERGSDERADLRIRGPGRAPTDGDAEGTERNACEPG